MGDNDRGRPSGSGQQIRGGGESERNEYCKKGRNREDDALYLPHNGRYQDRSIRLLQCKDAEEILSKRNLLRGVWNSSNPFL